MKQGITTYEQAVAYIMETPKFTTKNSMEDTKAFLKRLGNPEKELQIIHVAGTNGKGSVCAYMKSLLEASGKRVGLFTSPHLVDVRERFSCGGEMISREDFYRYFLQVYELLDYNQETKEGYHPTFFEFLFFVGILYFAEKKPDYVILETGLGGRLDATNAVSNKCLSVLTSISLEHTMYLGDTLEAIAAEKAGILMEGVPVVYFAQGSEVTRVFEEKARELFCPVNILQREDVFFRNLRNKGIDFSYNSLYYKNVELSISTIARYQVENASLALRSVECLLSKEELTVERMQKAMRETLWTGRMEEVLPEVFVDGAHNADGIRAFLETVSKDGFDGERVLIFSVVTDKDYCKMIRDIVEADVFSKIAIVPMQTERGVDKSLLEAMFGTLRSEAAVVYDSIQAAMEGEVLSKSANRRIYIAGSLYLVGEIKGYLNHDQF